MHKSKFIRVGVSLNCNMYYTITYSITLSSKTLGLRIAQYCYYCYCIL